MKSSLQPLMVESAHKSFASRAGSRLAQQLLDRLLRQATEEIRFDAQRIPALYRGIAAVDRLLGADRADMRITPQMCEEIPADWLHVPPSRHDRVLLYVHGGGGYLSLPRIQRLMVARWCRKLDARALIPHYRQAPEHATAAGVDDCLATYRWLLCNGVLAKNIVLCGDANGADLALATLMRARDTGLPLPAAAVLLSPLCKVPAEDASQRLNASALSARRRRSTFSGDFKGLPPLLIQVGSHALADGLRAAAQRAHAAGVAIVLQAFEDMPQAFHYVPYFAQTGKADERIAEFLQAQTSWSLTSLPGRAAVQAISRPPRTTQRAG